MVKVRVRLYRGHDYDLLPLAEIYGAEFASIAKKALEALFLGKEYHIDISGLHYVPTKQVRKEPVDGIREKVKPIVYLVRLSDKDCPGIENWFRGFACGHRNNLVKLVIRRAIGSFPIAAYRNDGWMSAEQESNEVKAILANIEREKEEAEREAASPKADTKVKKKDVKSDTDTKSKTRVADKHNESSPTQIEKPAADSLNKEETVSEKETHEENKAEQQQATITYTKPVSYEQEYVEEDDGNSTESDNDDADDEGFDVFGAFEALHND